MKKLFCAIIMATACCVSCSWLEETVYTQPTGDYIQSTPDGMASAVLAMYYKDRELFRNNEDVETTTWMATLIGDDITYCRAGEGVPQFGRYENLFPNTPIVGRYWKQMYAMIGYANMVIAAADKVDMTNETAIQAVAEAKCFRAHSYLRLIQRFDNIYLTTRVTTPENIYDSIRYVAAAADSVYALIDADLKYAIAHLPLQTDQPGRFTQGVARLLKAKSAAWQGNWSECAAQVNAIEQSGVYSLLPDLNSIFNAADLNHQEAMLVSQWSKGTGGWFVNATTGTNSGHRMCVHCTPKYNDEQGMMMSFEYGGYPWGRMFPNQHLLDLYDKQHDRRYEAFYRTTFQYNNPASLPRGRQLGDTLIPTNQAQYLNVHPMITKYNDSYTKASVSDNQSFKDIIIYRLPEAYILGCEAYIHLNNPDSARYYYNKTWTRAGNAEETGTITIAMLADEQARELAMEGDRWNFLKREGLLIDYVRQFGGEQVKNDKGVVLNDDVRIRSNIQAFHVRWPIPQTQIDIMKTFPQNEGY